MNPDPDTIPLPKEPRHQRFADLVLAGRTMVDAYLEAGFKCSRASAKTNSQKLRQKPDVLAYIKAVQTKAADESTLSTNEILRYCARVVRVPITKLDPRNPDDPNADLIKTYTIHETEEGASVKVEKHDPFKAISTHMDLSGLGSAASEANSMSQLAQALAALGPYDHHSADKM